MRDPDLRDPDLWDMYEADKEAANVVVDRSDWPADEQNRDVSNVANTSEVRPYL